jgi:hypothetical protein
MRSVGALILWISVIGSGFIGFYQDYWPLLIITALIYVPGYYLLRIEHLRRISSASETNIFKNFLLSYFISGLVTCAISAAIGFGLNFLI